jgi:hypothetical protein
LILQELKDLGMITGFNTDVSCSGTTYHVQTEDKGSSNPVIISLIYLRGAILAAKRTSYAKYLEQGLTEEQLQVMLEKQHRTILAAIKAGRIQELIDRLNKQRNVTEEIDSADIPKLEERPLPPVAPPPPLTNFAELAPLPPNLPSADTVPPPTADTSVPPLWGEFDLDRLIFEHLRPEWQKRRLNINLRGSADFFAGEAALLQIEISRPTGELVAGAGVTVKIIGTAFKPQIYSGSTGQDGVAVIPLMLPQFSMGTAAVVVQVANESGEGDAKYFIKRR